MAATLSYRVEPAAGADVPAPLLPLLRMLVRERSPRGPGKDRPLCMEGAVSKPLVLLGDGTSEKRSGCAACQRGLWSQHMRSFLQRSLSPCSRLMGKAELTEKSVWQDWRALYVGLVGCVMAWGDIGSGNRQLVFVTRLETCLRRSGTHGRLWSAIARAVPS